MSCIHKGMSNHAFMKSTGFHTFKTIIFCDYIWCFFYCLYRYHARNVIINIQPTWQFCYWCILLSCCEHHKWILKSLFSFEWAITASTDLSFPYPSPNLFWPQARPVQAKKQTKTKHLMALLQSVSLKHYRFSIRNVKVISDWADISRVYHECHLCQHGNNAFTFLLGFSTTFSRYGWNRALMKFWRHNILAQTCTCYWIRDTIMQYRMLTAPILLLFLNPHWILESLGK